MMTNQWAGLKEPKLALKCYNVKIATLTSEIPRSGVQFCPTMPQAGGVIVTLSILFFPYLISYYLTSRQSMPLYVQLTTIPFIGLPILDVPKVSW